MLCPDGSAFGRRNHHAQCRMKCFICDSKAAKKAFEIKETFLSFRKINVPTLIWHL